MSKFSYPNHPFIIAEMSGNHNQSLDRALEMIEIAAKVGADAVKLQTYSAHHHPEQHRRKVQKSAAAYGNANHFTSVTRKPTHRRININNCLSAPSSSVSLSLHHRLKTWRSSCSKTSVHQPTKSPTPKVSTFH